MRFGLLIRDFEFHAVVDDIAFQSVQADDLLIAAAVAEIPVSYTHLDVYKRQIDHRLSLGKRLQKQRNDGNTHTGEQHPVHQRPQHTPVSYTHLDVYKRQHKLLPQNPLASLQAVGIPPADPPALGIYRQRNRNAAEHCAVSYTHLSGGQ